MTYKTEEEAIEYANAIGHRLTHASGATDAFGQLCVAMPIEEAKRLADLLDAAAAALDIADDWHLTEVDIPPVGSLEGCESDETEGWCSTRALAKKLRENRDVVK